MLREACFHVYIVGDQVRKKCLGGSLGFFNREDFCAAGFAKAERKAAAASKKVDVAEHRIPNE